MSSTPLPSTSTILKSFKISDLRTFGFAVETGEIGGVPPVIDAMVGEGAVLYSCAREKAGGTMNDKMKLDNPAAAEDISDKIGTEVRTEEISASVECG